MEDSRSHVIDGATLIGRSVQTQDLRSNGVAAAEVSWPILAFTGALDSGAYERTRGGTLLIDGLEYGSLHVQTLVSRVIGLRPIRRVSGKGSGSISTQGVAVSGSLASTRRITLPCSRSSKAGAA